MKILYGVVGEGMGHATRSRVVLDDLARDHEVRIVASGRASDYLARRFGGVDEIWGLTLSYDDNEVRQTESLIQNLRGAVSGWPRNIRRAMDLGEDFGPDLVISDFETFAAMFAAVHRLPLVAVDNIQVIDRCAHDPEILAGQRKDFELERAVVRAKVPGADHYVITTFFYPPVDHPHTTLVPSILRPEILAARSEAGDHVLVYQTATGNERLPEVLRRSGLPCRIYGLRRDLEADHVDGGLTYRPFSESAFVDDLRTARAVVAGGGFTLLSEAVYLHKPILSIPLAGQFEQVLNARYVERLGYGMHAATADDAVLGAFRERIPEFADALEGYAQEGNAVALAIIRERIASALADHGR
jgi:uncharacterized protein (TIGR00661 family)